MVTLDLESLGVTRNAPLGAKTTYRVGGCAAWYVEVHDEPCLLRLAAAIASSGARPSILVLGRGSNLLVADSGFDGVVVRLLGDLARIEIDPSRRLVTAGGGVDLPVLARRSADAGLSGLEWAVGVPGTVGGAVAMNAGGHGADTAASLVALRTVRLYDATTSEGDPSRLEMGYRRSGIGSDEVVLWARFALEPGGRARSTDKIAQIVRWRRANQPGGSNAGSVFANPPGDAAGRLIEAAGLKGYRLGSAQVASKHANFIQADETGSADDVYELIRFVQMRVEEVSGTRLRTEVRLVGFPPLDAD